MAAVGQRSDLTVLVRSKTPGAVKCKQRAGFGERSVDADQFSSTFVGSVAAQPSTLQEVVLPQ